MWEVVRDRIGRKIPEIEKPVIVEVAVVFVVFVGVIWNRNQIEGFSLVEKFQNEDAMSELFQFLLDSDTTSGNSIQTSLQQVCPTPFKRDGFHRVGVGMGLTGVMYERIRSGDGPNGRVIVP